jgi:hypothetical protein
MIPRIKWFLYLPAVLANSALVLFVFDGRPLAAQQPQVTFYRDVIGILQQRCQGCHRPGEIGPMPLRTFEEVRPWSKAIKQAVILRRMPPWDADRTVGKFHNDPSLSQKEIDTLVAWADGGAIAGDPKDAPSPRTFVEGWNIGNPDLIVEMPKSYDVPASGTIEYTYIVVPTGFQQDRWITGAEYRPGNRTVVHHSTVFVRPPESTWLRKYPVGEFFVPQEQIRTPATPRPAATTNAGAGALNTRIAGYVPGRPERTLPPGYGMLIPAGSDLVFQLHYTANGKPSSDRSRVGFVFSKTPPQKRVLSFSAFNDSFEIPPGAPNYAVSGTGVLGVDAELIEVYPHMHLRGKSMTLSAVYPTGEREDLLRVPKYDFKWQLLYEFNEPKRLSKGTRLNADGSFDNSANNPYNPDPKAAVRWGDQSWDEMMAGFFVVAVPVSTDPRMIFALR